MVSTRTGAHLIRGWQPHACVIGSVRASHLGRETRASPGPLLTRVRRAHARAPHPPAGSHQRRAHARRELRRRGHVRGAALPQGPGGACV
jgi:hypothetical protein